MESFLARLIDSSPPKMFCTAAVAIAVLGQIALTEMLSFLNSLAMPLSANENTHAHAVLGHRVRNVVLEPVFFHRQRGGVHQHVSVLALLEMRQAALCQQEGASGVDVVHQVVADKRTASCPNWQSRKCQWPKHC